MNFEQEATERTEPEKELHGLQELHRYMNQGQNSGFTEGHEANEEGFFISVWFFNLFEFNFCLHPYRFTNLVKCSRFAKKVEKTLPPHKTEPQSGKLTQES